MNESSIRPVVVLNIVGLTHEMLGPNTPNINAIARRGFSRPMTTVLPAVTCSAQATMLTGSMPAEHGIVGNGWYDRDYADVVFWKQSNHLIQGEKLYEAAQNRAPDHTTAKMFWWYNMYSLATWSMTPRPSYPADGRKIFDSYSHPPELRDELQSELGVFPLMYFWGPGADIRSSAWIAKASCEMLRKHAPSLTLVYLPHLDYDLQRLGPDDPKIAQAIREVDSEAGRVIEVADKLNMEMVIVSEYAITSVNQPVHINRVLRESGDLIARREPLGWETLDAGASRAFAVSDHQVAHVYVQRPDDVSRIQSLLSTTPGIDRVLNRNEQREVGLDHERSGELVAVAAPGAWFTYYFWLDDDVAPDYARTIDIHRKPGYDPLELFVDPQISFPKLKIARKLIRKKLGFRYYMDVIPLDASLIRGSHGRLPEPSRLEAESPVFISSDRSIEQDNIQMTDVKSLLMQLQFGSGD